MHDDYALGRFVARQNPVYQEALGILRQGAMCTAFVDFIFPRLADDEPVTNSFALSSLDEARAYLAFPVLGDRYRECVDALFWLSDASALEVFGRDDARKLQASLTLFSEATNEPLMRTMLAIWYDNRVDEPTITRLACEP
jgi:uncharacterized protein (DUF1810 family)